MRLGVMRPMTRNTTIPNHRPPHILMNESWYFITSHVNSKQNILEFPGHKDILISTLRELAETYKIQVTAWVCTKQSLSYLRQVQQISNHTQVYQSITWQDIVSI